MATPDTEPKLGWAASVRSGMWVALVLLVAGGVGAASPWGQGIWPEWPTEEERGQRVVTRNVQALRQRNNQFGRQPFVHHTIVPRRNKNTYSKQKEREQYEKKKFILNHPKVPYRRPAGSSRPSYFKKTKPRLKVDFKSRWRE